MRDMDKLADELSAAVENGEMSQREAREIWAEAQENEMEKHDFPWA
jgi:polyhydroxyalkanoate synthesis regulator phasin